VLAFVVAGVPIPPATLEHVYSNASTRT